MNRNILDEAVPQFAARSASAEVDVMRAPEAPLLHVPKFHKPVRVAIVHDWLVTYAGAERVLENIISCFPEADVFSLVDFLDDRSFLHGRPVTTSFLQKLPFARRRYRAYLALMPFAIEQFDLSVYDVVISSSHAVAKGVLTGPDQVHISYVHSPIRYAWDMQHLYLEHSRLTTGLRSLAARLVLHYIRTWDVRTANSVDIFVANSQFIARRIRKVYQRDAHVVFPPVDVDAFVAQAQKDNFYLTASRLVPYKRIDLIVEAFVRMPERRLVVIGDGPQMRDIRAKATANVEIMGYQPFSVLRDRMQRAKAFLCAAEEDFGISMVEAQACGTPVIAYRKGAAVETVCELGEPLPTGVFFDAPCPESIVAAVEHFEAHVEHFTAADCRENAERFSANRFRKTFFRLVQANVPALRAGTLSDPISHMAPKAPQAKTPRVLVIDQSGAIGGAELSLLQIVRALRLHIQVLLFNDGPFRTALDEAGVPVHALDASAIQHLRKQGSALPGGRALKCIASLVRATVAHARKADVIYVNTQRAMVIGTVAGWLTRRPVVWHLRDIVSREHFGALQLSLIKRCARFGLAHVIANSSASARAFTELTRFDEKRVEVSFDGISPAPFQALHNVSAETLRTRFSLPEEVFLVGSFSRLAHWKGQHVLLEAMLEDPQMYVVLVGAPLFGEDAYEAELRRFVTQHGLGERVYFLGFQEDIPACMAAMDVVVHTSVLPEPLGRVIVEGMLARRPVVAARAGGVPEIIEHGVDGLLCAPGNAKELAVAIGALRNDAGLRRRLVESGYRRALRQFDTSVSAARVEHVLKLVACIASSA